VLYTIDPQGETGSGPISKVELKGDDWWDVTIKYDGVDNGIGE
jgi:hypothetical protein